ncbi:hypothetical protein BJX70DRAFT_207374 [Aspergillus crustosus]
MNRYRRVKRAARACQRCHSRKVRCDATLTGFPCTNCRLDSHPCQAFSGGRDRQRQLSLKLARLQNEKPDGQSQRARRNPTLSKRSHAVYLPCAYYSFIQPLETELFDPAKISFLDEQGCLSLPNTSEVDVFVRHYFLYVHPFTPVIDEAAFWRAYRHTSNGTKELRISIFLIRSMIFAASCFVPIEVARQCGYESLLEARDDLYQKAKLVYESGIEKDSLATARATLLLTYYTSDYEVSTNSDWLRSSIRHAKTSKGTKSEMKRVWWSCLIRDRIIALGMRRPLQITGEDLDLYPQMLTEEDMNDEIFTSRVYKPEVKASLFDLLASLCHFVTAVTELVTATYPMARAPGMRYPNREIDRLDTAKSALLLWELDWLVCLEGRNFDLHGSIPLFSSLLTIYYHSARVALCNHVCLLLNEMADYSTAYVQKLEFCRCELVAAVTSIAEKVKQLVNIKAVDKLPISVSACTTTPYILLSIISQASGQSQNKDILLLFAAVNRSLSLRYPVNRILNLTSRALWLSRLFKETPVFASAARDRTPNRNLLFTLPLQQYAQLLRYIDQAMSIPQDSAQETNILYAAAASPCTTLSLPRCPDPYLDSLPQDEDADSTPVWMEGMENFFFGPGRLLSLTSSTVETATGDQPEESPGMRSDGNDVLVGGDDLGFEQELPENIEGYPSILGG